MHFSWGKRSVHVISGGCELLVQTVTWLVRHRGRQALKCIVKPLQSQQSHRQSSSVGFQHSFSYSLRHSHCTLRLRNYLLSYLDPFKLRGSFYRKTWHHTQSVANSRFKFVHFYTELHLVPTFETLCVLTEERFNSREVPLMRADI